jgi:hypothetical protein
LFSIARINDGFQQESSHSDCFVGPPLDHQGFADIKDRKPLTSSPSDMIAAPLTCRSADRSASVADLGFTGQQGASRHPSPSSTKASLTAPMPGIDLVVDGNRDGVGVDHQWPWLGLPQWCAGKISRISRAA